MRAIVSCLRRRIFHQRIRLHNLPHRRIISAFLFGLAVLVMEPTYAEPQIKPAADANAKSQAETRHAPTTLNPSDEQEKANSVQDGSANVAPAAEPSPSDTPLEENGLIAQMLRQIDWWGSSLENELSQVKRAMRALPVMLGRVSASNLTTPAGQALLVKAFLILFSVFAVGLILEWALRYTLRRPRLALIEHARQIEVSSQAQIARDEEFLRQREAQESAKAADAILGTDKAKENVESEAGIRPPAESVALVRSERGGVEHIDTVAVGTTPSPTSTSNIGVNQANVDPAKTRVPEELPDASSKEKRITFSEHRGRLRQFPLAIAALLIDLLPLALFFFAAGLLLHLLSKGEPHINSLVHAFINAYVSTRVAMAVVRFLISPADRGIPILRINHRLSILLYKELRRIIVLAAFGIGLADAAQALGAGGDGRLAIIKVVSLMVHLCAALLIFHVRQPIGRMIAAPTDVNGPIASIRNWLAQSWAYFAATLVMGVWVVWALGIQDGFPKLVHFIGVTMGVLFAARIVAILILGALGSVFQPGDADINKESGNTPETHRRWDRYYPLAQQLTSIIVSIGTVIVLFQVWGLDIVGWFLHRAVGRNLLSALLTIAVAVLIGLVVWEAVNSGVERRLANWSKQGDIMRAARLRTLLPIMRTCLFIIIVLVVGLTTLNEIGVNTTPLLAGASIVGVALGFGSQKLVQDFITGIFLLMENAMQVGDWVTVAGVSGTVEYLSIRTVKLRAGDGSLHIVPFSSVSTVNNSNRGLGNAVMRVSVGYGTDVELVINELKQIGAGLRANPAFHQQILNDLEIWGVDAVDGSTVTLAGQIRCTDKGRWGVQRELNRQILDRFRHLGIPIADPRAVVVLPRESAAPIVSATQQTV